MGCLAASLKMTFEKGASGQWDLGPLIATSVAGSDLEKPDCFADELMDWSMITTNTLTYNSLNPFTSDDCNSVIIDILKRKGPLKGGS